MLVNADSYYEIYLLYPISTAIAGSCQKTGLRCQIFRGSPAEAVLLSRYAFLFTASSKSSLSEIPGTASVPSVKQVDGKARFAIFLPIVQRKVIRREAHFISVLKLKEQVGDPVFSQNQGIFIAVIVRTDRHISGMVKILLVKANGLCSPFVFTANAGKPRNLFGIGRVLIAALQINLSGRIQKSVLVKIKVGFRLSAGRNLFRKNFQRAVPPESLEPSICIGFVRIIRFSLQKSLKQAFPRRGKMEQCSQCQQKEQQRNRCGFFDPEPAVRTEDFKQSLSHVLLSF